MKSTAIQYFQNIMLDTGLTAFWPLGWTDLDRLQKEGDFPLPSPLAWAILSSLEEPIMSVVCEEGGVGGEDGGINSGFLPFLP